MDRRLVWTARLTLKLVMPSPDLIGQNGNSDSHEARPVDLIITMILWFRTSRSSTKNSLSRAELECAEPHVQVIIAAFGRRSSLLLRFVFPHESVTTSAPNEK